MADLTLPASRVRQKKSFDVEVTEFENRVVQARALSPTSQKEWELVYENQTLAEWQTFDAFFELKKGPATAFTWINPNDSTTYTVRFVESNYVAERAGIHYAWQVTIREEL